MSKKISTIEELGEVVHEVYSDLKAFRSETGETFKSIGDHLVSIEGKLEELT